MEDKLENQYFASLYANEKAFIVQTKSGFRLLMLDTLFPPHICLQMSMTICLGKLFLRH